MVSFLLATQNPLTLTEDKLKFPELRLHGSSPDPSNWMSLKWVLFYSPVSWLLVFSNSKSSSVTYPPFLLQTVGWSDFLTSFSRSLSPTTIGQRAYRLVLGLCRLYVPFIVYWIWTWIIHKSSCPWVPKGSFKTVGLWCDLSILKIPGGRVARKIAQRLRALDFLIEDSGVCCGGWSAVYPRSPFSCSGWSASVGGGSHQNIFRDAHLLSVCDAEEKNRVPPNLHTVPGECSPRYWKVFLGFR